MTNGASLKSRAGAAIAGVLASLLVLLVVAIALAAAVDAGYARRPLVNLFSSILHRRIIVDGAMQGHLLSTQPYLTADLVTVRNPPWMADGVTAHIQRVLLHITFGGPGHHLYRIERLEMQGTTLTLLRDESGAGNWQMQPPHQGHSALAVIHHLSMRNMQTDLDDERQHLKFHGIVSAMDGRNDDDPWLHVNGVGQLNGSAMRFAIVGDPLETADHGRPYRFTFSERSGDASISGRGSLPGAFRMRFLQTSFEAAGDNLRDLYRLVGLRLINTGPFHLTGTLARDGDVTRFEQLQVNSGGSDVRGSVVVDSTDGHRRMDVDLSSNVLRLSDLGEHAAHGEPAPPSALLLPSVALNPATLRRRDASIHYQARRLEAARITLEGLDAHATLDKGLLNIEPVTAAMMGGTLRAQIKVDAHTDDAADWLQLQLYGVQVAQLDPKPSTPPRFDASVDARIQINGHGASLHELGARANGTVAFTVPHGTLRTSLAELSGLDLRGLGLALVGSRRETPIQCGAATFTAADGTLTSQTIVLDTDETVIRGSGTITLADESLAIRVAGHPTHTRLLRVHAPLLVGGTLRHPHVAVETPRAVQLLSHAEPENVDCSALLSATRAPSAPVPDARGSPPSP